jgi:hypothetical protein
MNKYLIKFCGCLDIPAGARVGVFYSGSSETPNKEVTVVEHPHFIAVCMCVCIYTYIYNIYLHLVWSLNSGLHTC